MVATLGRPLDVSSESDVEINHIVCCIDGDVSFCGEDMEDASRVTDDSNTAVCLACWEVDRRATGCPFGKKCPE